MRANARHRLFVLSALAAAAAQAARDPFLPIDYAPPAPKVDRPANVAPVVLPPPAPTVKPITEADWAEARKAVKISGVAKSVTPATGVTVVQAMINRHPCSVGDTVTFIFADVRFQWRVESISDQSVALTPLKAERLPPQSNDLKGNP